MKRIGLLSDTHGYVDDRMISYLSECDEIWHAGDMGTADVADTLEQIKPLRAVWGNIDGYDLRIRFPEIASFEVEGATVLMKHIGGYPGRYDKSIRALLSEHPPMLFISGHSHILKVCYDKVLNILHMNPGAAGLYGQQQQRTLIRFNIDQGCFKDLEVIELGRPKRPL